MSNQEILERAIYKAIYGGWRAGELATYANILEAPIIIFNHNFAKALWGEEPYAKVIWPHPDYELQTGSTYLALTPLWQYHLQQMVIADDPIKYLGENL